MLRSTLLSVAAIGLTVAVTGPAHAQQTTQIEVEPDATEQHRGSASILVGPGYTTAVDRADARISLRGEAPLVAGQVATLGVMVPVTIASQTVADEFAVDVNRTAVDINPGLRGRIAPTAAIQAYLDAGIGVGIFTDDIEAAYFNAEEGTDIQRVAPSARAGIGLEFGGSPEGGLVLVIEPLAVNGYLLPGNETGVRMSSMIGLGATF